MDPELKKAFGKLQEKMRNTEQKLKISDAKIESLKRTKHRAELTIKEMATLNPSTKTYESVGRMFLLDNIENIKMDLKNQIKSADEKILTLEHSNTYLQKNLKESEDNLREMVMQHQRNKTSSSG